MATGTLTTPSVACFMRTNASALLLISTCLLTACSGGLVRGEPPLVGLSTVELGDQVRASVSLYNPNDENMNVARIVMSLSLGEQELDRQDLRIGLTVHRSGTEEIVVNFPVDDGARQTLARLEDGETNSVAYSIHGEISNAGGDSERFSQEGYLYPVPGRPGHFRGAGPQRERPRERPPQREYDR